jgi:hypothetical protein
MSARIQRAGDPDVSDLLDEARAIARRTGALVNTHDIRLFLDGEPATDELGLTARDREVMDLVRVATPTTRSGGPSALADHRPHPPPAHLRQAGRLDADRSRRPPEHARRRQRR